MSIYANLVITISLATGIIVLAKRNKRLSNKYSHTHGIDPNYEEIVSEINKEYNNKNKVIVQCLFYDPDLNLKEKILYAENIEHAKELAKEVMTHSVQLAVEKGGFDEEDEYDVMNTAIESGENHNGGLTYNHLGMLRTQIMIKHGVLENVEGSNLEEVFSFMDELLERFDF